ncbi:DNA-directed RNA polymerase II subunit RPB1 isoform X1 [Homalodisca vitripennis]|uniref:DNA-directed RNA polymerase II subunit RPB1 isoform X1 n=1 Tax=Homalodisca vitripennis TaxID=197043 RepID=UPI001EEB0C35|nr:DNA-directed RNA polymerase II subunit RPB1 isoform X1 [Homalodisca vitripennis]XP_046665563.1 DNA-directed RNA polymerase II subunit RPB1 isoform X1 [Homalodisca vitripennis]
MNYFLLCAATILSVVVVGVASAKIGGWDTAPNTQYHIQTDEGPERYFKYQTISGQYRKEKRLEDGTVVGTYGWVDPNGYLRLRDYIADGKGYRIVRTKKVLVGADTPISNAVSAAKKVPSQGGVGVQNAKIYEKPKPSYVSSTYRPELASNALDYSSSTVAPISLSDFLKQSKEAESYPSSTVAPTVSPYVNNGPEVYITPNSYYPSAPSYNPTNTPTPSPYYEYTTPAPTSTPVRAQTFRPYFDPNSVSSQNYYSPSASRRVYDAVGAQSYSSGQEQQFPLYDGVSMTHNGFRYYLPRHYHEEENLPGDKRAGSFGYIDPFGIRRVIYYNASPGSGFVHRKNNRYVGFESTPYDPRF